jgi:hypothetical protein
MPGTLEYRTSPARAISMAAQILIYLPIPSIKASLHHLLRPNIFPPISIYACLDLDLYSRVQSVPRRAKRAARSRTWLSPASLENDHINTVSGQLSMGEPILRQGMSLPTYFLVLASPATRRISRQTPTAVSWLRQKSTAARLVRSSERHCAVLRHALSGASPIVAAFQNQIPRRGVHSGVAPLSATYITSDIVSLLLLLRFMTNVCSCPKMFWPTSNPFRCLFSKRSGHGGMACSAYCFFHALLPANSIPAARFSLEL